MENKELTDEQKRKKWVDIAVGFMAGVLFVIFYDLFFKAKGKL